MVHNGHDIRRHRCSHFASAPPRIGFASKDHVFLGTVFKISICFTYNCIYIYIYIYISFIINIHTYLYIFYIHIHIYIYTSVWEYIYIYIYIYMHVCIHIYCLNPSDMFFPYWALGALSRPQSSLWRRGQRPWRAVGSWRGVALGWDWRRSSIPMKSPWIPSKCHSTPLNHP